MSYRKEDPDIAPYSPDELPSILTMSEILLATICTGLILGVTTLLLYSLMI